MKSHKHIIKQVPPDYYQLGIKGNLLQKFWHTKKLNEVLKAIENTENPKKILDVGCASGWFISEIQKRYPRTLCYGIDIYDDAIKYARKRYPKIKFNIADAHKIPYKDETFDIVVCTEVLEHVDDPGKVLTEIKRVLKRNSTAIIELDSGSWLFSVVWFIWRKFKGRIWNDSHLHSFNVKKLENLINQCGFRVSKKKKFDFDMAMIFYCLKE